MIFNSFQFLWLFPIIFCVYWTVTRWMGRKELVPRWSNYLLIAISYGLYLQWKPVYALVLLGVTAVTYLAALKIERDKAYGKKKYIVCSGIIFAVLPLLVFKYYNFLNDSITELLGGVNIQVGLPGLNWAMPLGISFFTLQAIGYLVDVYLQRIKAERNWWDYMLFVCFFPQIASGPISKAADLLPQIKTNRSFNYSQIVQGLKWLLWGMFMKVVVADRLGLNVNDAYVHLQTNGGLTLFMASICYTMEVYCDFAGYSFMALGVGKIMGFELINNFQRPFFSQSITDAERFVKEVSSKTKLIFVASPMYSFHTDHGGLTKIKELCKQYNVPVIDHFCDGDNPDLYIDMAHLNREGAEKWSRVIASEIKKYVE